ncbi:glycoside hydrolase family 3 protein [Microbacterium thalassium]|uniref:Beta-glucosidase n=1 Tax=Microbacterium thalassium TaxID=362649 RepID=A0A7X0KU90_9MICO|nr:glycoside hydrolase family 3 protein [Microbacterium thalassium]MBB6390858.1 beta-glucosidase [Microbacterium thalassium]GLK25966.1 beta-glucosidase [Microbacterium thalassium]
MATRKEIKTDARTRLAEEKAAAKERRAELKAMTPEERSEAKAADRAAARAAQQERKAARASMNRAERREAKRRERAYKRTKHRPRRLVGWGIGTVAVVGVVVLVAPYASGIARSAALTFTDDTPAAAAAREAAVPVAEAVSDEGIVLLKNEDEVLPLSDGTVNVFSFASFNLQLGGGGSGGGASEGAPTLYEALEAQGVTCNQELYAVMEDAGAEHEVGSSNAFVQIAGALIGGDEGEPAPDYLTDDVMAQAAGFSDTAIVVVGNAGSEGSDFTADTLRLSEEQTALLDRVTASIPNVIVVVNSGNQMELGFLDEYPEITGAVWIGTPGPQGAVSLAKVLTGEVNPSGRLTDTYAYDVESAPATENLGDYSYENVGRAFLDYEEGIYVGYRYYETRYAGDAAYDQIVQFPFGYGLSYTTFDWTDAQVTVGDEVVMVDVTVTNTGDVAGKDVVEVYFAAPYTPGGIEKSAIELAGYAKTSLLEPGQTETVAVTFATRDMSSWSEDAQAYVLEKGDYDIVVGTDVSSPVFTVGTTVGAEVVYDTDDATGESLESLFDDAEGDLTYLSRDDWDGTYPTTPEGDTVASDELLALMNPELVPVTEGEAPAYGADNGLMLEDLKGLDYDDPQWEVFLDQLTLEEQIDLFSYGAYLTESVDRLGIPAITMLDSPAGLNSLFSSLDSAFYPSEIVIASTWNDALAYEVGASVAAEAAAYGIDVWYAPGMNLHRTAMGGRDFEYFSEDPLLSGKMAAGMVSGAEENGLPTTMKHFALNDQEVNARSGINVFVSEQALRELYLRPFEITVKESPVSGAMSSFINIGGVWAGGNGELLQDVLRDEWGFEGFVITDAVLGGWMDPVQAALNGNDLMLAALNPSGTASTMAQAAEEDPIGIGNALRDRVHAVLFTVLKTNQFA